MTVVSFISFFFAHKRALTRHISLVTGAIYHNDEIPA